LPGECTGAERQVRNRDARSNHALGRVARRNRFGSEITQRLRAPLANYDGRRGGIFRANPAISGSRTPIELAAKAM